MTLPPNEVLNKWVTKLFKVCNWGRWQFTEPNPVNSLESDGKRPTYDFVWSLLEVQNCLESPCVVRRVFHCHHRTLVGGGETLEVRGTPEHLRWKVNLFVWAYHWGSLPSSLSWCFSPRLTPFTSFSSCDCYCAWIARCTRKHLFPCCS